jgi:hypothetical protein
MVMGRQSGESLTQFAIRKAYETGHFWSPDNPDGANVTQKDLPLLSASDPVVIRAMISMTKMDASRFTRLVLDEYGRPPVFDGEIGPATEALVLGERCPVPDFAPPPGVVFAFGDPDLQRVVERMQERQALAATGSGNWRSCHNIGPFHCAIVDVDKSGLPAFLAPLFPQVLQNVQQAYAEVGLLFRFRDRNSGIDLLTGEQFDGQSNTDMSFVPRSDGWIGLAIVGTNEDCASRIWCKFLNTYKGGSTPQDIITQWTTLIKHELGHNCGRSHTNGGVMNPSLVNGLPTLWSPTDPSTAWLRGQFGGERVKVPGAPDPGPGPTPPPVSSVQAQLDELRLENVVQQVSIDWLIRRQRSVPDASQN